MTNKRIKTSYAICKHCSQYVDGSCECEDYKRCRDCPMPRCVMLADQHPDAVK